MRERAQVAEKELERAQFYIAGVQDDNAALQKYVIGLQGGLMEQAVEMAKLRTACDI